MKVFCNGFNLYNKFKSEHPLIEKFKQFHYENIVDLEVSLTFAVLKSKTQDLYVSGGNANEIQKIKYNFGIIVGFWCTNDHVFVLNKKGQIFKVDIVNLDAIVDIPTEKALQADDTFVKFAIGDRMKVGLTRFGHVYDFPQRKEFGVHTLVDVKVGGVHSLILDSQGNVYSFGSGSRGQLGLGSLEDESNPVLIEALAGIPIVAIACGTWHCAVISKDGDLYTWGWNQNGQLGLPVHSLEKKDGVSVMASPHVVDFPDTNANAVKVACGKRHTIVLLDNGKLFGCGMNKYKQLLNDNRENIEMMTFLHDFSREKLRDIKCGPWNSVVCCED